MDVKLTDLDPMAAASETMGVLPRGAFLTVKCRTHLNTMTIGWGTVGIVWSRPVFMVAVRQSRHTFKLIEQAPDFTVTVPNPGTCTQELAFCGSRSGKGLDKFAACGLRRRDSTKVQTPLIDVPGVHWECRLLLRTPMSPDLMSPDLLDFYPGKDYHTLYYGEVMACRRQSADS